MNIILTAILLINFLFLCGLFYAFYKVSRIKKQFSETITAFITAPDEKTPSPLAQFVENASHVAGRAVAMEVKTTLMGKASVAARQEQAIIGDVVSDTVQTQNPLIAGVLDSFPSLKKRLLKNPQLAMLAGEMLQKVNTSKQSVSVGSNGDKPKFSL